MHDYDETRKLYMIWATFSAAESSGGIGRIA
jgi:hypothetical protein